MLVGRHGGRRVVIAEEFEPEMADGMGPRLGAIRHSWIWKATRESLAAAPPEPGR